jgi:hypothetical protein
VGRRSQRRLTNLHDVVSFRTRRYLCRPCGDRGLSPIRQNKPTIRKNGLRQRGSRKKVQSKLTASIYHNTECDWDLLKTYHTLREEWCRDIPTKVQWVKGHADREGRDLMRDERLNILADLLADTTRNNARKPYGVRPNCPH